MATLRLSLNTPSSLNVDRACWRERRPITSAMEGSEGWWELMCLVSTSRAALLRFLLIKPIGIIASSISIPNSSSPCSLFTPADFDLAYQIVAVAINPTRLEFVIAHQWMPQVHHTLVPPLTNPRLNLAFFANLFNTHTAPPPPKPSQHTSLAPHNAFPPHHPPTTTQASTRMRHARGARPSTRRNRTTPTTTGSQSLEAKQQRQREVEEEVRRMEERMARSRWTQRPFTQTDAEAITANGGGKALRLAIRLPTGQRLVHAFAAFAGLADFYAYIDAQLSRIFPFIRRPLFTPNHFPLQVFYPVQTLRQ
ncbi:hypothetical protein D9611_007606 [Ephemerocybe angulata]|uniref:UBX domain-containing protein n=1 Tax=Ephemerocybe angulata TaxID=980116 RepID=A0A8H5BXU9_9AGAR|nr:hypothetical protein D9611_007606 [Tulosesus angulatus]